MAVETPTQLKTYFQTGDKPTQGQFINLIDSAIPALVYRALLTQGGGAVAPTATVLENIYGTTFSWSYNSAGDFIITADSGTPFTVNKTLVFIGANATGANKGVVVNYTILDSANIEIFVYDNQALADSVLNGTSFEILTYP